MAAYAEIVNHDILFHSATTPPVVVNELDIETIEDKERLNQMILTTYEGDTLNILPTCDCTLLRGEYNVGVRCTNCGTLCVAATERPLESLLWIAAPKGVDALMNPQVWTVLKPHFTIKNVNLLAWLTNPLYILPNSSCDATIAVLKGMGIERGINFFYNNFDRIMSIMLNEVLPTNKNQQQMKDIHDFIVMYRESIFSKYIPIPSKMVFITESTATGVYADTSMTPAIEAIRTICSIENPTKPLDSRTVQGRAMRAVIELADFYQPFFATQLGSKHGWFRKHVFGSRMHFSFRAVISSTSEQHHYEELHLPWSLSVMLLKAHLTSKLLNRGFTPNEVNKFLYEHTLKFHPLLKELFDELIAESPRKGIPVIFQRNPTLTRLSAQRLYVTKIKDDPSINTVSLSVLVLPGMNADFDGDALNGIVILDEYTLERFDRFSPSLGVLDLRKPRALSSHVGLPAPIVTTIANWLHHGK